MNKEEGGSVVLWKLRAVITWVQSDLNRPRIDDDDRIIGGDGYHFLGVSDHGRSFFIRLNADSFFKELVTLFDLQINRCFYLKLSRHCK